jgi:hypothetical protein
MRFSSLISQAFLALLVGLQEHVAIADTRLRNLEIQQCTESDLVTWNNGRDQPTGAKSFNFFYVHKGAPSWFTEQQVKERLQRAANEWSKCGIPAAVDHSKTSLNAGENGVVVYWDRGGGSGIWASRSDKSKNSPWKSCFSFIGQEESLS